MGNFRNPKREGLGNNQRSNVTRSEYRNPLNLSNSVDYEAMKKNGWVDQGLLIVSVDDPNIGWVEREMLRNIGNKLYGPRREPS